MLRYIENNVYIESKATILKGVTIGKYSVIGASAVVVNNVTHIEVWSGVTAKLLRKIN